MMAFLILHWLKMKDENGSLQMTVVQKAQLHVAQLRREASKQRINVSDAIMDMKVGRCRMLTAATHLHCHYRSLYCKLNQMIVF